MVYFIEIRPTKHYMDEHEKDVPWKEVVKIILNIKNPRKKGNKFEIEEKNYYILFEIKDNVLYVINAKKL